MPKILNIDKGYNKQQTTTVSHRIQQQQTNNKKKLIVKIAHIRQTNDLLPRPLLLPSPPRI